MNFSKMIKNWEFSWTGIKFMLLMSLELVFSSLFTKIIFKGKSLRSDTHLEIWKIKLVNLNYFRKIKAMPLYGNKIKSPLDWQFFLWRQDLIEHLISNLNKQLFISRKILNGLVKIRVNSFILEELTNWQWLGVNTMNTTIPSKV